MPDSVAFAIADLIQLQNLPLYTSPNKLEFISAVAEEYFLVDVEYIAVIN
ncbi:MAG: hypothetical protein QNJ55_28710 [Xenococcus sp. MO_188.B8]|nr:hypothetical protein [Xenococcus sp. MO_188.B8]